MDRLKQAAPVALRPSAQQLTYPIRRRQPFRLLQTPALARLYSYPHDRWPHSRGRQILFGAPFLALFALLSKTGLCPRTGEFELTMVDRLKPERERPDKLKLELQRIRFDARNTQFQALYLEGFAGGYEPEVTALLDVLCARSQRDRAYHDFLDIGSNWGYFSLFVASNPEFTGHIWAMEPYAAAFRDLQSVVAQAGLSERIDCLNCALSNYRGHGYMDLPDHVHSGLATLGGADGKDSTGGNGGDKLKLGLQQRRDTSRNLCTVMRLDDLPIEPGIIKIDAEGSEAAIIEGGAGTIAKYRPDIILESSRNAREPEETLRPLRLLRDLGYEFFQPCWERASQREARHLAPDKLKLELQHQLPPKLKLELQHYLPADQAPAHLGEQETLALVPLPLGERLLRHDQINLFACHGSRRSEWWMTS